VAHLERTKPNTYAHQVLVQHLAAMEKNPRVQADLANRAAYESDAVASTPLRGRVRSDGQALDAPPSSSRASEIARRRPRPLSGSQAPT
jgi:hypothetical protein